MRNAKTWNSSCHFSSIFPVDYLAYLQNNSRFFTVLVLRFASFVGKKKKKKRKKTTCTLQGGFFGPYFWSFSLSPLPSHSPQLDGEGKKGETKNGYEGCLI